MKIIKKFVIISIVLFTGGLFFAGYGTCETSGKNLPLVETGWLADRLDDPQLKIIYVDDWPSRKKEYSSRHIPGSAYLDVGALMDAIGIGRTPPDRHKFESLMSRLGIHRTDRAVLYSFEGHNIFTLGAYWLMEYFGHEKISYLNGGLRKWIAEEQGTTGRPVQITTTSYKAGPPDKSMRVDAAYVLKRLNDPDVILVDTRSSDEYQGKINHEKNLRVGHIPGAVNLDSRTTNFNEDGTLKPARELKTMYNSIGATKNREIIVYCQGAIKTATTFFVLKHMLGYPDVKSYLGSWGEWGNMVDFEKFPVE